MKSTFKNITQNELLKKGTFVKKLPDGEYELLVPLFETRSAFEVTRMRFIEESTGNGSRYRWYRTENGDRVEEISSRKGGFVKTCLLIGAMAAGTYDLGSYLHSKEKYLNFRIDKSSPLLNPTPYFESDSQAFPLTKGTFREKSTVLNRGPLNLKKNHHRKTADSKKNHLPGVEK